jgi:hypothetical protein
MEGEVGSEASLFRGGVRTVEGTLDVSGEEGVGFGVLLLGGTAFGDLIGVGGAEAGCGL